MSKLIIPVANQLSYNSIRRNKDLKLKITNHCNQPSHTLVIDWKGDCFVCGCEAWLPVSVGNIKDFEKLEDVWLSTGAIALQKDIDNKLFTHCAVDRCGILDKNIINNDDPDLYVVSINIDESCNLRCPSCRTENIMLSAGDEYKNKLETSKHIVKLLESFTRPLHIVMSGNGDPLASSIMRPLLHQYKPKSNQTIRLFTNGLLLKKQLSNNNIINYINRYFISIDAGSKDVYECVRLGGNWEQLLINFNFLREVVDKTNANVLLMFVLQNDNYLDMNNFINLCIQYNFNGIINRLENWGTWGSFEQHDVIGNINHPNHNEAMKELKKIYTEYKGQILFNASLIQLAKETM